MFLFLRKTPVYPHPFRNRNEKQFRITSFSATCDSGSLAVTFLSLLTAGVGLWPRCGFLSGESASWASGLKQLKQSSSNSSYSPKTADFFSWNSRNCFLCCSSWGCFCLLACFFFFLTFLFFLKIKIVWDIQHFIWKEIFLFLFQIAGSQFL